MRHCQLPGPDAVPVGRKGGLLFSVVSDPEKHAMTGRLLMDSLRAGQRGIRRLFKPVKHHVLAVWMACFLSQAAYAVTMIPVFMDGSPTYPAGTEFDGFVSESRDPLAPFSETSVTFTGIAASGQPLVYRYRLDFDQPVVINHIVVAGAAWGGCEVGDVIRLFDAQNVELGNILAPSVGNTFQSVTLVPTNPAVGSSFFLEEVQCDTEWRYRSRIAVDFGVPFVPFAALAAQVALSIGLEEQNDAFTISHATFILGDSSDGIAPPTEAVTLRIGTVSLTIPPGSFHPTSAGAFAFAGVIDGVTLQVTLTPLTRATFALEASGAGATLRGIAVPVPVGLTIGDDSGSTTLPIAEVSAHRPPPQREALPLQERGDPSRSGWRSP
jgi:hypothetical protein